jgi:anti-anti-sigma factor
VTSRTNDAPGTHTTGVEPERLVLHPVGELDHFSARNLLDAMKRHLAGNHTKIVLDLTSLSFCDSSGVSLASSIGSLAADRGIGFELRRSNSHVGRVFELLPT